jgi:hypothetical protein
MQAATDPLLGWQRIKGLDGVTRDDLGSGMDGTLCNPPYFLTSQPFSRPIERNYLLAHRRPPRDTGTCDWSIPERRSGLPPARSSATC